MVKLVDTHCHLYSSKFDEDRAAVIAHAKLQGLEAILMPNVDMLSVQPMLQLATEYPDLCYPMMGMHPCSVIPENMPQLDEMLGLFEDIPFIAVGEIGLDFYWDKTHAHLQIDTLEKQIEFAKKQKLPIVLHTRSAMHEVVEILESHQSPDLMGVFHCYSESYELSKRIIDLGFYFGIGGVLTYKNSGLDHAIKDVPIEKIILETDAPYLAPIPHRGKRNEPAFVWNVANKLAEILGMGINEVGELTATNARKLFAWD